MTPGGTCFGCRDCLNLTYRSAQEHDSRVDKLVKNPLLLLLALRSPKQTLRFLGMKAYAKLVQRLNRKAIRSRTRTDADPLGQAAVNVV